MKLAHYLFATSSPPAPGPPEPVLKVLILVSCLPDGVAEFPGLDAARLSLVLGFHHLRAQEVPGALLTQRPGQDVDLQGQDCQEGIRLRRVGLQNLPFASQARAKIVDRIRRCLFFRF